MGPPLAPFYRLTKHYSLKGEGRALRGEVTREVEGEPGQGGARSQSRGSDTVEVSNDSPGTVLLNYGMHVHTGNTFIRYEQLCFTDTPEIIH